MNPFDSKNWSDIQDWLDEWNRRGRPFKPAPEEGPKEKPMRARPSTGTYPPDWTAIAFAVKDDAGWKCKRCGHVHDIPNGYMLTVHHLDLNKSNCRWWNIPPL